MYQVCSSRVGCRPTPGLESWTEEGPLGMVLLCQHGWHYFYQHITPLSNVSTRTYVRVCRYPCLYRSRRLPWISSRRCSTLTGYLKCWNLPSQSGSPRDGSGVSTSPVLDYKPTAPHSASLQREFQGPSPRSHGWEHSPLLTAMSPASLSFYKSSSTHYCIV